MEQIDEIVSEAAEKAVNPDHELKRITSSSSESAMVEAAAEVTGFVEAQGQAG